MHDDDDNDDDNDDDDDDDDDDNIHLYHIILPLLRSDESMVHL